MTTAEEARESVSELAVSRWSRVAVAAIILVLIGAAVAVPILWATLDASDNWSMRGSFGDAFAPWVGILTAGALLAAIWSVAIQRAELRLQLRELQDTKLALRDQARALARANELSLELVQETSMLRESTFDPRLSLHIDVSRRYMNLLELVVQNRGNGPALNLSWELDPSIEDLAEEGVEQASLDFLSGLTQLAPGQSLRTFFGASFDVLKSPCPDIRVKASYTTAAGKPASVVFVLSPRQLQHLTKAGDDAVEEIAKSLKKIASSVRHHRLQVDAHSLENVDSRH